MPSTTGEHRRGWLFLAALGYLSFVVYGSLVPLDFRPRPMAEAWDAFRGIRYLQLGIASRADWVANVLLFVPLAFLWLGVAWPARSRPLQVLASATVLASGVALSICIEFTQIFFPPRTVSLNDIYAESIGAGIGIAAWWMAGPHVAAWFTGWMTPRDAAERLLYGYLFVLFGYSLLPLDLTISPVELFHKLREGKVHLIPFSAPFPTVAQFFYDLLTDLAIWIPAAFLWRVSAVRSTVAVVARVVAAAALLELFQLFVYSRVTDVTDVLTAALGGIIGGVAGAMAPWRNEPRSRPEAARLSWRNVVLWSAGLLGIVTLLAAVFWYPFDFRTDWGFVQERIAGLRRAPLSIYYHGTEFRAVTEVLHKLGFFLPLGAWLALGALAVHRQYRAPRWLLDAASVALVVAAAAAIESGQLFLPSKHADLTDFALEAVGGVAGYFGGWFLFRIWQSSHRNAPRSR